jgi:TrpR-related protein YerC/YecD
MKKLSELTLYEALLALETTKECENFLADLCTPQEVRAMEERWRIAQLLDQSDLSYRTIHDITGASLATIGRVARFLKEESYKGYRLVLDRLSEDHPDHTSH